MNLWGGGCDLKNAFKCLFQHELWKAKFYKTLVRSVEKHARVHGFLNMSKSQHSRK